MSTVEPVTEPCHCTLCLGESIVEYTDDGHPVVMNNLHGKLRPCEECGRPKTEYVDLGTKGRYECWWCTERAAGTVESEGGSDES